MTAMTAGRIARRVMAEVFGPPGQRPFTIRYWDGYEDPAVLTGSSFTLVLRHPRALRRMLLPPSEVAFGKAFLRGDLDLEGDVEAAVAAGRVAAGRLASPRRLVRIAGLLLRLPAVGRIARRPTSPLVHPARPAPQSASRCGGHPVPL